MTWIFLAAVGAALATNAPTGGPTNQTFSRDGFEFTFTETNNPVEQALQKLMQEDDAARAEVNRWYEENERFAEQGAGLTREQMARRARERFAPIRKGYADLIQQATNQVSVRLAYASFLGDLGEEEAAIEQLEVARGLDASNPAIWNNLANLYGHNGEVKKSFEYYAKAIALEPNEAVYYHNFGTTVFLFRKDAREFYGINEQQVFDKALALYSNAIRLDPADFQLAADVAQTFYGIQPWRVDEALASWTNAYQLAPDESSRQGVHLHFARVNIRAGRFDTAQGHLTCVTNAEHAEVKQRVVRTLETVRAERDTNQPPAKLEARPGS
jgi:tetratricopeptide (TPR) repeat protein